MAIYLSETKYAELIAALEDHRHDPVDSANAVRIALGELADIWPESIRDPAH